MTRTGILRVFAHRPQQRLRIENVDAHGGADHGRVEPRALGIALLGFLLEPYHPAVRADLDHPVTASFLRGRLDGSDGDFRFVLPVPVQHFAVVHLVDVVAAEDQRFLRRLHFDALEVLKHGIRGALIPVLADPLHGRKNFNVLAHFRGKDIPAVANVPGQVQGFVLC